MRAPPRWAGPCRIFDSRSVESAYGRVRVDVDMRVNPLAVVGSIARACVADQNPLPHPYRLPDALFEIEDANGGRSVGRSRW